MSSLAAEFKEHAFNARIKREGRTDGVCNLQNRCVGGTFVSTCIYVRLSFHNESARALDERGQAVTVAG